MCVTPSFREPLLVKKRFPLSAGTIKIFILLLLLLCLPYLQPNHMSLHHMIVYVIDRDRMQAGNDKPLTLWHRKIGKGSVVAVVIVLVVTAHAIFKMLIT